MAPYPSQSAGPEAAVETDGDRAITGGSDMWTWEHLAIGYLAYSLLSQLAWRRPPTVGAAITVAFGTQFPDLVDKPLG